jgi:lauroyl/myristoyl acyltransferase
MIESEVRRDPGLWFWFHNRWKTRPETETQAEAPGRLEADLVRKKR